MMNKRFLANKRRFDSFWALYLMGVSSIFDIKYTVLLLTMQMMCGVITVYQTNQLMLSANTITINMLLFAVIVQMLEKPANLLVYVWLSPQSNAERLLISERITDWVHQRFNRATFQWRRENPNKTQIDAIDAIFNTYFSITWNIANILTSSADTVSFVLMAFYNSWIIGCVVVMGTITMTLIRRHMNIELERVNSEMGDRSKENRLVISNQYTNRAECTINPLTQTLMSPSKYNPVNGLSRGISIWDARDQLSNWSRLINEIFKSLLLVGLVVQMIQDYKMVLWIMINGRRLFGLTDIIARTDEVRNLSSSRLIHHLKIIDTLDLDNEFEQPIEIVIHRSNDWMDSTTMPSNNNFPTLLHSSTIEQLKTIETGPINFRLGDGLHLTSLIGLTINMIDGGITMLDGKKGSGKSITMDLIGGMYDGKVCSHRMLVNGRQSIDEFRDPLIATNRLIAQQLMSDLYRLNPKGTLTMSLSELFPGASYPQIYEYLVHFDMVSKMPPQTIDALDIKLGKNERSFSPGELQAMVLASFLYKGQKLKTRLLLLDEIERNIDLGTVMNIFDKVIIPMIINQRMTIVMVTHNDELKAYLKSRNLVTQTIHFRAEGKTMSFSSSGY